VYKPVVAVVALASLACKSEERVQLAPLPIHLVVRNHTTQNVTVRVRIGEAVVFHAPTPAASPEGPLSVGQELRAPPETASLEAQVGRRTLEHEIDLPLAQQLWLTADVHRDSVRLSVRELALDADSSVPQAPVRIPATLQN
jgi:hypothetical protein